jgi:GNAT superfamily N-acetyltransferase
MPEIDALNHAPRLYTTPEGHLLRMREACPDDTQALAVFIERVSYGGRYFRFGHGDYQMTKLEATRLCHIDPVAQMQLVVIEVGVEAEILAHAECYLDLDDLSCEFGILVADAWCGHGIGRWLMAEVLQGARARGVRRVVAKTMMTNRAMINLARHMGFSVTSAPGESGLCLLSHKIGATDAPA